MTRKHILGLVLMLLPLMAGAETRIIAHRGYWDYAGGAENSLAALRAADRIGAYASELDVHITRDGKVVVYHNDDIVMGGGRDTVLIETARFADIRRVRLPNGERLPTLSSYLAEARRLTCRLVVEVKAHRSPEAEDRCVREVLRLVRAAGLEDRVEYISFSKHACERLHAWAPKAKVAYLEGDLAPRQVKELGLTGIDYHESVFKSHPEWVEESHALGLTVNVWTVNDPQKMEWLVKMGVDFITTNRPEEALKIAGNQ